jgi:hypothetical protein
MLLSATYITNAAWSRKPRWTYLRNVNGRLKEWDWRGGWGRS